MRQLKTQIMLDLYHTGEYLMAVRSYFSGSLVASATPAKQKPT